MSHLSLTLRVAALLALATLPFGNGAEAGLADNAGSALSSLGRLSPAQRVQYYSFEGSNYCWYDGGWNGPGWYWCGDEWDAGFGWGGPYGWNGWGGGFLIRRHGRHGVGVWHSRLPNVHRGVETPHGSSAGGVPRFPGPNRVGALPSAGLHGGAAPALHPFGGGPGFRHFSAGAVGASPHSHLGGALVSPGFAGGGLRGLGGGGRFHGGIGAPHIGAPASPGFTGGGFHGLGGGIGAPHIASPASPGFSGGGFRGLGGGGFGGGGAFSPGGHGGIGRR